MEMGEFTFPIDPVENLIGAWGRAHIEDAGEKADIASLHFPGVSIFYFLFAFFARLLPINWMSWTTTIRTRMVATMTSAWKRW